MVNNSVRITPRNSLWCDLHWQVADSNLVSWIIINGGEKIFGPLLMNTQFMSRPIPDQHCDGTRSKGRFVIESITRAARRQKPESMTVLRTLPKPNAPLN